jgi:cytochrome b
MDGELSQPQDHNPVRGVLVWDLPTRLFHWLLAALILLLYLSGEFDLLDMRWHFWCGYATLALILFRVLWGFFGSQTSRFAEFIRAPGAVAQYARALFSTNPQHSIGHNPLGGWSVLALLTCVLIQSVTGLFSSDEIDNDGPLVTFVSGHTVKLMTRLHHSIQNVLLALIGLHVAAVLFYLLARKDNLITPMFSGRKQLAGPATLKFASVSLAIVLLIVSAAIVAAMIWFGG